MRKAVKSPLYLALFVNASDPDVHEDRMTDYANQKPDFVLLLCTFPSHILKNSFTESR